MTDRVRRSWLIVPANDSLRLDEATGAGADVIVLDMQDTVHESHRPQARERLKQLIPLMCDAGAEVFVRVDIELLYADLQAAVWRGLSGIMLPGVTSVEQVQEADRLLAQFEAERGVVKPPPIGEVREADDPRGPEQALELHLCLDTGRGNWDAEQLITVSPRVRSVSLGRADLVMDLRAEPSGDLHLLPYLMQRLIIIANAMGVTPIGAWWKATSRGLVASYDDTLQAALSGRQAGFKGALCMRAHQVEALNTGFTPSAEEIAQASAIHDRNGLVPPLMTAIASALIEHAAACRKHDEAKARVIAQTGNR